MGIRLASWVPWCSLQSHHSRDACCTDIIFPFICGYCLKFFDDLMDMACRDAGCGVIPGCKELRGRREDVCRVLKL